MVEEESNLDSGQVDELLSETLARKLEESGTEIEESNVDEPEQEIAEEQEDSGQEESEEESEEEEADEEDTEEAEFMTAPGNWSKKEQEEFDAMPDEYKAINKKRYESMETHFLKVTSDIGANKKDIELWNIIFDDDNKAELKKSGVNPQQYVSSLMDIDRQLSANPAATIKALMEHTGVSAKDLGLSAKSDVLEDDFDFDDEVKEVKQPDITSKPARNTTDLERQVLQFEFAVDDNGQRLHPHFNDETMGEMEIIMRTNKASSLEEAYGLSPTVRELTNLNKKEASKESLSSVKKKTAKAKKAANSVTNKVSNSVRTDFKDLSLRDHLSEKMRQASS